MLRIKLLYFYTHFDWKSQPASDLLSISPLRLLINTGLSRDELWHSIWKTKTNAENLQTFYPPGNPSILLINWVLTNMIAWHIFINQDPNWIKISHITFTFQNSGLWDSWWNIGLTQIPNSRGFYMWASQMSMSRKIIWQPKKLLRKYLIKGKFLSIQD